MALTLAGAGMMPQGDGFKGQDVIMKSNSETQWEDTRYWVDFTVDTGNYDAGALNASFCVYPNSGAWGMVLKQSFGMIRDT